MRRWTNSHRRKRRSISGAACQQFMAGSPKKSLALDTNLLLDLAGEKDFFHEFKEDFSSSYLFKVGAGVQAKNVLAMFRAIREYGASRYPKTMNTFGLPLAFFATLVLGGLSSIPADAAAPVILHVATDGNDAWSGRSARPNGAKTDGPLASLTGARDAVRGLKERGLLDTPVRVQFATGTYALTVPVEFVTQDSGTEAGPIIYEAASDAKPLFTGGRVITGWKPAPNGVWTVSVPEVKAGRWYFEQLWVNGERATRARTPNQFYYYMVRKVGQGIDPLTGKEADLSSRAITGRPEDIASVFQVSSNRLSDVTAVVYHSWEVSRHRVAGLDKAAGMVITSRGAPWAFFQWGGPTRYHLENFRAHAGRAAATHAIGRGRERRRCAVGVGRKRGKLQCEMALAARRTFLFSRFGGAADELLELASAIFTAIFVDWHTILFYTV